MSDHKSIIEKDAVRTGFQMDDWSNGRLDVADGTQALAEEDFVAVVIVDMAEAAVLRRHPNGVTDRTLSRIGTTLVIDRRRYLGQTLNLRKPFDRLPTLVVLTISHLPEIYRQMHQQR